MDERDGHALVRDAKVHTGTLRLRAPQALGVHLNGAHGIVFEAGGHGALHAPFSGQTSAARFARSTAPDVAHRPARCAHKWHSKEQELWPWRLL